MTAGLLYRLLMLSPLLLSSLLNMDNASLLPGFAPRWPSSAVSKTIDRDNMISSRSESSQAKRFLQEFFDDWDQDFGLDLSMNPIKILSQSTLSGYNKIPIDVKETEKAFEITADLPGVSKDNTKVEIADRILKISVEEKSVDKSESETFRRLERFHGLASRSIRLPVEADEDKAQASFDNGVLTIRIQKLASTVVEKEKGRFIPIK